MAERPARAPRRARSATESLLSIVLVLEALLVFFVTLVVFALDRVSPPVAFTAGGVFFVVVLALARLQRFSWAIVVGHAVQVLLIAAGLLEPLMYLIGALFAALWVYCFVTGRRLDRRNAAIAAEYDEHRSDHSTTPDRPTDTDQPDQTDSKEKQ
ncbi:DUF4233 domain-containing protein [Marisediminicola sp. LYQ85]|uniref:DUF4233 domain-containing protein n=1 Tax=Marisediminicola sp. LYQ85 TaxID=3391062 RepID=UPI0039830BF1